MLIAKQDSLSKLLPATGLIVFLAACSSGGDGVTTNPGGGTPGTAPATPQGVQVVSGDSDSVDVQNTISWTLDPDATSYTVYWDNAPGVTDTSSVLVPAVAGSRYVVHSGVDVMAGNTYYYRVQATSANGSSGLSAEMAGTPQATIVGNALNDVAWNGVDRLVAVGDNGEIMTSANGTLDAWTDVSVAGIAGQLSAVTWDNVNAQFLIVGAGSTVLTGDGATWTEEDLSNLPGAVNLNGAAWLGDRYIAVGNNGTILTSNIDGSVWTAQDAGAALATASFSAVATNNVIIVAVGTNGTIANSNDAVVWVEQARPNNNDLNDITWDGSQFVVVGSDDTVLTSPDGLAWTHHIPGTSDINFVAVTQWDAGLPANPVVATVGSAGTFVINPDADPGTIVRTGTTEQMGGLAWVDDGVLPPYFAMVGHDGAVMTARYN